MAADRRRTTAKTAAASKKGAQPAPKAPSLQGWKGPRKPRDLNEVVRIVPDPDGGPPRRVSLIDAACEALRTSGILEDAAARCGVDADTLRNWQRVGVRAINDILAGRRKLGALSAQERSAAEFAERTIQAAQEGKLYLAGLAQREAQGGYAITKTVVKTRQAGDRTVELERVTTTETARPDGTMIRWMLACRDPQNYGRQRVELSGPDGGAIPLELRSATDSLLDELGRMAAAEKEVGALLPSTLPNGKP